MGHPLTLYFCDSNFGRSTKLYASLTPGTAKASTPQLHITPSVSEAPEDTNSQSEADFSAAWEEQRAQEGGHRATARQLLDNWGYQHLMGVQLPRGEKRLLLRQTTQVCKAKGCIDRHSNSRFVLINSAPAGMIFCHSHEKKHVESMY